MLAAYFFRLCLLALLLLPATFVHAQHPLTPYLQQRVQQLETNCQAMLSNQAVWLDKQGEYRNQLFEMLGLSPLPEKTDLQVTLTGILEHEELVVEKLHFQSRPGLYVTANLYRPKNITQPLPAILYVCGHSSMKQGKVSLGNKAGYQHHGAWFARNGYVCLVIDSLQLGEIEGIHHGTHKYGMWWWVNRGYTPAGVEAWNCIRALDYLETRTDVDKNRLGVTGRSGGGAYSWWIAALDDRIQCAVPVAGTTDLQNHVVQHVIEGHCDCMFMHNTYLWDYPQVAALVAPRPLLLSNTDTDTIFPLDGVLRTHEKVRSVYRHFNAADKFGFNITPGGHKDTQELQMAAFRWLNHYLRGSDTLIALPAEKLFEPAELRVFTQGLPADEKNTTIHESFVPTVKPAVVPENATAWQEQCRQWEQTLREQTFRAWPTALLTLKLSPVKEQVHAGLRMQKFELATQPGLTIECFVVQQENLEQPKITVLNVLDAAGYQKLLATYAHAFTQVFPQVGLPEKQEALLEQESQMLTNNPWTMAYVVPRGIGATDFTANAKDKIHVPRRLHLLGETLAGGQVFDVRCALAWLEQRGDCGEIWLQSEREMGAVALYAALFAKKLGRIDLHALPDSHRNGPYLWNIDRVLTLPEALACVATKHPTVLYTEDKTQWHYAEQVAEKLGWNTRQLKFKEPVVNTGK